MDIIKRIGLLLKDDKGDLPWPYGFDSGKGSSEEIAIRKLFKPEELLAVSKHNPFLKWRNRAIRKFVELGVPFPQIVRLTGLSRSQLFHILSKLRGKKAAHRSLLLLNASLFLSLIA